MPGEIVLDASAAAKAFITETGSHEVRALVVSGVRMTAPDLIVAELANVAIKHLRRGEIPRSLAEEMCAASAGLVHELVPSGQLTGRAFVLAADHGLSTYDALYVALAEARGADLVTFDLKLITKCRSIALGVSVREP